MPIGNSYRLRSTYIHTRSSTLLLLARTGTADLVYLEIEIHTRIMTEAPKPNAEAAKIQDITYDKADHKYVGSVAGTDHPFAEVCIDVYKVRNALIDSSTP